LISRLVNLPWLRVIGKILRCIYVGSARRETGLMDLFLFAWISSLIIWFGLLIGDTAIPATVIVGEFLTRTVMLGGVIPHLE
jgi:hypothetical protein